MAEQDRRQPYYAERYRRTKRRLCRQRGPKVAQIDLSRRLTEAISHMLTRNERFASAGAAVVQPPCALTLETRRRTSRSDSAQSPRTDGDTD